MNLDMSCPACYSGSIKRISYFSTNSPIGYQYRTAIDKGACTECGSLWFFRSVVPHFVKKQTLPSYQQT